MRAQNDDRPAEGGGGRARGSVTATCFALSAFLVAVAAGLSAGNPPNTILLRALAAMAICYPLGLLVSQACHWVVRQHEQGVEAETGPDSLDDSTHASTGASASVEQKPRRASEELAVTRG